MSISDIHSVDYTVLLCANLAATRAFYKDVLRFPLEVDRETWVSFRVGGNLLCLRPRGPGVAWEDGAAVPGSAAVQLAFRVPPASIEACQAWLIEKGVPLLRGSTDIPSWRHRTIFFRDPEANIIEIYAEY